MFFLVEKEIFVRFLTRKINLFKKSIFYQPNEREFILLSILEYIVVDYKLP